MFLPALPAWTDLIGNLSIRPDSFTPNGDGVNDEITIEFSIFKVKKPARVTIYDTVGRMVREVPVQPGGGNVYVWDGRDREEETVPPGLYLCRIWVDADAGNRTVHRTIAVSY